MILKIPDGNLALNLIPIRKIKSLEYSYLELNKNKQLTKVACKHEF